MIKKEKTILLYLLFSFLPSFSLSLSLSLSLNLTFSLSLSPSLSFYCKYVKILKSDNDLHKKTLSLSIIFSYSWYESMQSDNYLKKC